MESQGFEKCSAEAHDGVDASHDLAKLYDATNDHDMPEERSGKDLGPRSLSSLSFWLQLHLHLL